MNPQHAIAFLENKRGISDVIFQCVNKSEMLCHRINFKPPLGGHCGKQHAQPHVFKDN
jgi:hypothetical protein